MSCAKFAPLTVLTPLTVLAVLFGIGIALLAAAPAHAQQPAPATSQKPADDASQQRQNYLLHNDWADL